VTVLVARIPAWQICALLIVAMALGWEVGRRLGRRNRRAGVSEGIGKLGDTILALFGLLLAFTFSLALAKHDQRRTLVIQESNAIGDFYTTASLLKDPVRTELQRTIRDYLVVRLDLASHPDTDAVVQEDLRRIQALHGRMAELASQAIEEGTKVVVPLTNNLNDVTSSYAARLAAFRDRLPGSIVLLLFLAAILCVSISGREQGLTDNVQVPGTAAFMLLVALTIYVTLDLNQPRRGLITVSKEPLENLLLTMNPK
jgi:hypothetical protein